MDIYKKREGRIPSTVKKAGSKAHVQELNLKALTFPVLRAGKACLDLIPSTLQLVDLDPTNAENRLKIFLHRVLNDYDYILIDCPPTMYFSTKSALIASDAYLIPVKPDHLSSFGFLLLEKVIGQFEYDYEKKLIQLGTVFTLVKGRETTLMSQTMEAMRSLPDRYFFDSVLTDSTHVAEAAKYNKTVFDYPKATSQANQMKGITEELFSRLEEVKKND